MNRLSRELIRSLKETERNLGNPTFRFAGADIPCSPNEATTSKLLGLGGESLTADLTLFVRVAVLPATPPKEKQILTFRGREYRIDKIGRLAGDEVLSYICNDASEGD